MTAPRPEIWPATELAEFLVQLSGVTTVDDVVRTAVGSAAESFDAEVAALVFDGRVVRTIGFPAGDHDQDQVVAACRSDTPVVTVPGLGEVPATVVSLQDPDGWLLVARAEEPLSTVEAGLLAAMGRSLTLALRAAQLVAGERELRQAAEQQATQNKRLADAIAQHAVLEQFLLRAARNLIGAQPSELDRAIRATLGQLGDTLGLDRCVLMTRPPDGDVLSTRHEWARAGLAGFGGDLDAAGIHVASWFRDLSTTQAVVIAAPEEIVDTEERAALQALGIAAAVVVPVFRGSTMFGALALINTQTARDWRHEEVNVLRVLGEVLGSTLDRREALVALGLANEQLRSSNEDLARSNEQLRVLSASKDEFVSMASHELRTPLTSILGFTETLRRHGDVLGEVQRDSFLDAVERHARRLHRLVADLLDVSRIESGKSTGVPSTVRLRDELDALVREDLAIHAPHVTVDVDPDLYVFADPDHVRRIVINLVENASKYGEPPIEVAAHDVDQDTLELIVRDHGPGVPSAFQAELFEKFTQASTGVQREATGTGLGLAIVRGLAHVNGGDIRYEDRDGACFVVTFRRPQAVATP